MNAQEVLDTKKIVIDKIVDARKVRFDEAAAWELVKSAQSIVTARGKKVSTWDPKKDDRESIIKHIMGPSGNLRAPAFLADQNIIIGFNPEFYQTWLEGA